MTEDGSEIEAEESRSDFSRVVSGAPLRNNDPSVFA